MHLISYKYKDQKIFGYKMNTQLSVWIILGVLVRIIQTETYFETIHGSIELKELRKDRVDGKFRSSVLQGENCLNFFSEVSNDQSKVNLSYAGRKNFISYHFKENAIGYMQIGEFVFIENLEETTGLHVNEMSNDLNDEIDEMLYGKIQQQSPANISKEYALTELKKSFDMNMLESLALALGGIGVTGGDYPSLLSLYIIARVLVPESKEDLNIGFDGRVKREIAKGQCPNPASEGCKQKPVGSTCLGMCGPDTRCWSWVCGDCCEHRGCLQHDKCCRGEGMLSVACLSVWRFKCHSYSC